MSFGPSGTQRLFAGAARVYNCRTRLARAARIALAASIAVSVVALVVFHIALFWNQINDGRLLDPAVAMRWALGVLLLGAIESIRRAGVPVLWGRRALVVWVLVALLHWAAAPAGDLAGLTRSGPERSQVLVDLPGGAAAGFLTALTLFLLCLLRTRAARRAPRALRMRSCAAVDGRMPILSLHLASRAPPAIA